MKFIFFIFFIFFQNLASAHPVVYKDGWALSSSNMESFSNNYIMYSMNQRSSLGLEHWRFQKDDHSNESGLVKFNYLAFRENASNSQANIYLHTGLGFQDRQIEIKETNRIWMFGIEADWETRILYSSLKHLEFTNQSISQLRIGFSPNERPFEELQTWMILQGMIIRGIEESVMITPMLRFFYHNVLWELGSSTKGNWMINLMVHY